jgi:hypothetical protein
LGPPSLISSEYQEFFPWGKAADERLIIHLHLVLSSRMVELYLHSPITPHGILFYYQEFKSIELYTLYYVSIRGNSYIRGIKWPVFRKLTA